MTPEEALQMVGDVATDIAHDTPIEDFSNEQKTDLLEFKLTEKGFPFQDKKLVKGLILRCKILSMMFVNDARHGTDQEKVVYCRTADLLRVAAVMMKKKSRTER